MRAQNHSIIISMIGNELEGGTLQELPESAAEEQMIAVLESPSQGNGTAGFISVDRESEGESSENESLRRRAR